MIRRPEKENLEEGQNQREKRPEKGLLDEKHRRGGKSKKFT